MKKLSALPLHTGWLILYVVTICLFGSCASASPAASDARADTARQETGLFWLQAPDPSSCLTPLRLAVVPGEGSFSLSGGQLGAARISGSARALDGDWILIPSRLDWFNNWSNGWTEAGFAVSGELVLHDAGNGQWLIRANGLPLIDEPLEARIRYGDTYYYKEKGLTRLGNRWACIQAVTPLLREYFAGTDFYFATRPSRRARADRQPDFIRTIRPYLFPELYGYDTPPAHGFRTQLSDSIYWNLDYSAETFPEQVRSVRDSASLLRGFEESPGLWYLSYIWPLFWEESLPEICLTEEN